MTRRSVGLIACESAVILGCVYLAATIRLGLDNAFIERAGLWKAVPALTRVCSATVSTGIDQTLARASPTNSTQAGSFGSCRWGGGAR